MTDEWLDNPEKAKRDIHRDYQIVDGIIKTPGKFEGEMEYVPYYWNLLLNGCSDEEYIHPSGLWWREGVVFCRFDIDQDERKVWGDILGSDHIWLSESDDGFVCEGKYDISGLLKCDICESEPAVWIIEKSRICPNTLEQDEVEYSHHLCEGCVE